MMMTASCAPRPEPAEAPPSPIPAVAPADDRWLDAIVAQVGAADYLAVGATAHHQALEPLLAHRRGQGHEVAFVSLEALEASRDDSRTALRKLIATLVERRGALRYVLLAGDVEGEAAIASFEEGDPTLGGTFATDHPYGDVEGEALAIGRVPVQHAGELAAFVDKVIGYETREPSGAWQRRLSLFAGAADFGPLVDRLIENHARRLLDERLSYDWDVNVLFSREGSPYASRFDRLSETIEDELENGALVAVYVGHGYEHGFAGASYRGYYYPSFGAQTAEHLLIEEGRPLFLSLSCLTGDFTAPQPSLGERLILNPDGPVAVLAASGRSHPYANALFAETLLDAFFAARVPTMGSGVVAAAEAMLTAELAVAQLFVSSDEARVIKGTNRRMYHLLGDPATRPRYPRRLEVATEGPARPGRRIGVRVEGVAPGTELEVTLETARSVLPSDMRPRAELEALDLWAVQSALSDNRARALDKVLVRVPAAVAPSLELRLPADLEAGRYYLKVFSSGASSAVGHAVIEISGAHAARRR